jgi:hypothetical protein
MRDHDVIGEMPRASWHCEGGRIDGFNGHYKYDQAYAREKAP